MNGLADSLDSWVEEFPNIIELFKVHTTNRLIMLTIKVKSELDILASERKTTFTVLYLTRVLKTATRACIP